jgi:TonB family protein
MPKAARKTEPAAPEAADRPARSSKKLKLPVLLITAEDELWPQVGADLSSNLVLKQLDSIDELVSTFPAGQPGIVLWDARNNTDPASVLTRLHQHSTRFAIVALDSPTAAGAWTLPLQHRQIVAHVAVPISGGTLAKALESSQEEVQARMALLGDGPSADAPATEAPTQKPPVALIGGIAGAVVVVAAAVFFFTRHGSGPAQPGTPAAAPTAAATSPAKTLDTSTDKVDALIEKAQQAMQERHYIDPAAGSALALYRDVLIVDPNNGEAHQGLQRLAEILITRVQAALDDRKFDVALQSLETARSIDANDARLSALDERIASLRAELGPAQITAAINAQNFDRATQLIDEAARAKSLPAAKLAQLRDEVRKHRDDVEFSRVTKIVDARLQQDKLTGADSAAFYLDQARQEGTPAAALLAQTQELQKRLAAAVHSAIDQRRFADADHNITELHALNAPAVLITGLQHDLARAQSAAQKPELPQYLDLAQSRLTQGRLIDPENDNALYYVNQLKSNDPKNTGLAQVSGALQSQLLAGARTALDGGDLARADSLVQAAGTLGASADLDALNDKLRQKKAAGAGKPLVVEQSLTRINKLEINYPYRAMQAGVEGWVELRFTVKADGNVANVRVTNAAPADTFDQAATKAVSKVRYQPVIQDGKAVAVETQVRVSFRIPK